MSTKFTVMTPSAALDYGPRKLEVAERVMRVLESTALSGDPATVFSSGGGGRRVRTISGDSEAQQQVHVVEDDPDEI